MLHQPNNCSENFVRLLRLYDNYKELLPKDYGTSQMSEFVCVCVCVCMCGVCVHKLDMESREGKIEYLLILIFTIL